MLIKMIKNFFKDFIKKTHPISAKLPDSAPLGLQIQVAKRQTNNSY